jgi:hypothetical protein
MYVIHTSLRFVPFYPRNHLSRIHYNNRVLLRQSTPLSYIVRLTPQHVQPHTVAILLPLSKSELRHVLHARKSVVEMLPMQGNDATVKGDGEEGAVP